MFGVGLMVGVVGLGSSGPELKSCLAVELIPGGVDSACWHNEYQLATLIEPFKYPVLES